MSFLLCLPLAICAQDLKQIRQRGYLRIGTSGTAPPNTWVNSKNELIGYDIDWAPASARS